jgi:hypothetical protein
MTFGADVAVLIKSHIFGTFRTLAFSVKSTMPMAGKQRFCGSKMP